ncbi:hypothetical protein JTB14_026042 [Gonioctena quinquepunctata]|nr:hypothetical protein JTB14_026042 [Gonioctena quinquepunctata]
MDLILAALKNANELSTVHNHQSMLEMLCCDRYPQKCLGRTCEDRGLNILTYAEYDDSKPVVLKQWFFCDGGCDHYKLGSIKYKTEVPDTHLNVSTVFTDSKDDNLPLSTYVRGVTTQQEICYSVGDFVLIKNIAQKTEYRYAGI